MKKVLLGEQGLEVSRMGLGCMGMSDFYKGKGSDEDSIMTIQYALDNGISFLDTADMYGPFTNEILIGKAIKGRRDKAVIATKFGVERSESGDFLGINGRPEYVKASCEGSLKRLGVEYIDLYYQHRVDPNVPIEETVGAMKDLVNQGKVKYIGLSEAAPSTLRKAHKVHPISALQTEYSLWTRDPENEILDVIRELGIGFVAYSPLGRGFLTGKITNQKDIPEDDFRRKSPRFMGENFSRNLEMERKLEEIAGAKKATPAQIALAWLMAEGDDIVPIPGTRRIERLQENIKAVEIELSQADLEGLDKCFPPGVTFGERYSDMSTVNR